MADVRFGIDASGAQQGAQEFNRALRSMVEQARATQAEIARLQNGGAASPQANQAAQQQREQARAIQATTAALREKAALERELTAGTTALLRLEREKVALAEASARATARASNEQALVARAAAQAAQASQAAGQAAQQQAKATEQQAQAAQKLNGAQKDSLATADRVLANSRQELALRTSLQKALASQDAAERKAAQSAVTALSTLGGANRALAQRVTFEDRLRKAIEAGIVTEAAAIQIRRQADVQFSTAAVKARDLRTNIAGLNQSVAGIARAFALLNPTLGLAVAQATALGGAVRSLNGGFATLGIPIAILVAAAAAFTAIGLSALKAEESLRLTALALQSSGRASGLTIGQIQQVATEMARTTGISDEAVLDLTRSLIHLRGVTEETFGSIIRLAADAAARGFGTFEGNAKAIARLISNTQAGEREFKRLGVTLSEVQRQQIKNLGDIGDASEQARFKIGLLAEAFGGAAEQAAANKLGDAFKILGEVISDYIELIGKASGATDFFKGIASDVVTLARNIAPERVFPTERPAGQIADDLRANEARQQQLEGLQATGGREAQARAQRELNALRQEAIVLQKEQAAIEQRLDEEAKARSAGVEERARREAETRAAALQKIMDAHREGNKAQEDYAKGLAIVDAQLQAGTITEQRAIALKAELRALTIDAAAIKKAEADAQAIANKQSQEAYDAALRLLRLDEEATVASQQKLSDLKFENDQMEKLIAAYQRGEEAVAAFRIEDARLREQRRQDLLEIRGDAKVNAEIVDQAGRSARLKGQLDDQTRLAKETTKVWDNAIDNIQRGFGDLFTNLILDGKNAFENIGKTLKDMFARVIGELVNANLFQPLFDTLRSGATGAARAGGGGQIQKTIDIESLANSLGGAIVKGISGLFGGGSFSSSTTTRITSFTAGSPPQGQGFGLGVGRIEQQNFATSIGGSIVKSLSGLFGFGGSFTGAVAPGGARIVSFSAGSPPQGQGFGLGVGRGGLPTGAGGSFDIGGAASSVAAGAGGIMAGFSLAQRLLHTTDYQAEIIGTKIGSVLGGIVGAVFGGIFGGAGGSAIGGVVGAVAGGALLQGAGGLIGSAQSGRSIFEASSGIQVFNRNILMSGDLLSALVITLLGRNKMDTSADIATRPTLPELQGLSLQGWPGLGEDGLPQNVRKTPFGFVGLLGASSGGDLDTKGGKGLRAILDTIEAVDTSLNIFLTESERALIEASNIGQTHANVRDTGKVVTARIGSVLTTLGIPSEIQAQALSQGTLGKQVEEASQLLEQRKAIIQFLNELRGTAQPITESAKALERIQMLFRDIAVSGPALGVVVDDLAALRDEAIRRVTESFNDVVSDAILSITDPSVVAANQLADQQIQRLREAVAIGADIVQVERLNLLERKALLEELNNPVKNLVDLLKLSPSGSSPSIALSNAEARFFDVAEGLTNRTGDFSKQDLATSAQTLLGLGEQFLGSPTFAAQRDSVLDVLEGFLLSDLPTTGQQTNNELQSLNLETARGNAITEQLLAQLISQNSTLNEEIAQLRDQLDRILAN